MDGSPRLSDNQFHIAGPATLIRTLW